MALTDKLVAIAAAIREKAGTSEKLTLEEMPIAIAAIETGGGSGGDDGVPNPIMLKGNLSYVFGDNKLDWLINNYGDRIQTSGIDSIDYMFSNATNIEGELPFYINGNSKVSASKAFDGSSVQLPDDFFTHSGMDGKLSNCYGIFSNYQGDRIPSFKQLTGTKVSSAYMFSQAYYVKEIGDLSLNPDALQEMFAHCRMLRACPNITFLGNNHQTYAYSNNKSIFRNCYSLRTIPENVLKTLYNTAATGTNYSFLNDMFYNCYVLEEIAGLSPRTSTQTANLFSTTFGYNYRIKKLVFDKAEDGTPYDVQWKNQTIDLHDAFGWFNAMESNITTDYNSGITADKKVVDNATYQALKNDPDWYSGNVYYSRYNHTSAVETINSLPDASEYLATQSGGTNTIKFRSDAGELTDGGAVGDLTEEEIAVATAKGWAVVYAV